VRPLPLPPNVLRHFYAGGERIAWLRGLTLDSDHMPEEWIGAVNTAFGHEERGLSRLEDGTLLRDAIAADPEAFLGPGRSEPGLLVKLLDAGQRLPVHFHPGRRFAREHLGLRFGKTEAWIILEAEPGATVHVGPREPLDPATVRGWVEAQDADEMLAALQPVPVAAGDSVLVPAGTLHAIGGGILLLELQEPTDLSVLVEWRRYGVNSGAEHLELGWSEALAAADRTPADPAAFTAAPGRLLPQAADPYFRAERLRNGAECEPSFAVLVALAGAATLHTERGGKLALIAGTTALVPYAAGTTILTGDLEAIRCLPPDPAAGEGDW
jgi:mannose-6-phosphate isomerase